MPKEYKMEKLNLHLNLILIIITFFMAIIQIILLNSYSTIGNRLTSNTNEIVDIQRENARLGQRIASVSAMNMISIRAKKINIDKSVQLFSFTAPIPVAYNLGPSM